MTKFNRVRPKGAHAGGPAPGSGLAKTRGMDPAVQAIIERLQPYHRGQAFEENPLWQLQELNRLDKHRVLHVIAATSEGFVWKPSESENVNLVLTAGFLQSFARTVRGRTQIARWRSDTLQPIDPSKKMRVNFRPNLLIKVPPGDSSGSRCSGPRRAHVGE